MCSIGSGLWCWDATTQAASDDAPSQRRGWRGMLSFSFEVRMRQGRVTLPCKSLRGVRAPNSSQDLIIPSQVVQPSKLAIPRKCVPRPSTLCHKYTSYIRLGCVSLKRMQYDVKARQVPVGIVCRQSRCPKHQFPLLSLCQNQNGSGWGP